MGLAEFPSFDEAVNARLVAVVELLTKEFEGVYDREHVRVVVDESAKQLSRGRVTPFIPVLAERFARERLRAQALGEGHIARAAPEVVFVSLTGGGRAQIGAALLARRAGTAVNVHSAGSASANEIDENVRAALGEIGIDLAEAFTKPISPEVIGGADVIVTMGRSVGEIDVPAGVRHIDWRVGDPAGADLDEVRRVREDIDRRVDALADELLGAPA